MLDRYEEARDRRLARHLVSLFHPGAQDRSRAGGSGTLELVPPDLLKKYVAYSRARCHPKLTDEAAEELVNRCGRVGGGLLLLGRGGGWGA